MAKLSFRRFTSFLYTFQEKHIYMLLYVNDFNLDDLVLLSGQLSVERRSFHLHHRSFAEIL